MERYTEQSAEVLSRVDKNNELYRNVNNAPLSRVSTNANVKILESNEKEINIEKIKKYISKLNDEKPVRRKTLSGVSIAKEEVTHEQVEEVRDYDINSVLEKAKQSREIDYDKERYKKIGNTQYDILSKIEMYDKKPEEEIVEEDFNTDERTLIDLINTVTIHKNGEGLLDELTSGDSTVVLPIDKEKEKNTIKEEIIKELEEKEKQKEMEKTQELVNIKENEATNIDKSFYTNSMSFSKEDFEGFEELEKSVKKNNTLVIVSLIVLFISIVVTLGVIANYVFDLGLF